MPRRYHTYPEEFQMLNVLSTAGASVMAIGYILPLFYLLYSLKYGKAAGPNPYTASGLEWTTQSPPLTENFLETPIVTQEAYAYAEMEIKGVGTV
jgi:cytochrome c oxidase subunit 1